MTVCSRPMFQLSWREAAQGWKDALARVEREGSGSGWARAGAVEGDEGKRGAAEYRKEVSPCLEECGVVRSLWHGPCQALCRELEPYGWADRKRGQGSLPGSSHALSACGLGTALAEVSFFSRWSESRVLLPARG